jgi:hypothetical protein
LAIGFAAVMSGCGSGPVNGNFTYNTTSTASSFSRTTGGQRAGGTSFGTWTFTDGALTASLVRTNNGEAQFTVTVNATCEAPSTAFGFQRCSVTTASCAAGAIACPNDAVPPAGENFFLKTVEGVALLALGGNELHAGIVQGSCSTNIAGDYLFAHMGVGSQELLGMYRLDAAFTNIVHADFGIRATDVGTTPVQKEVVYTTGDPNGEITLTGTSCNNGVWSIPIPGGGTIFATLTQSGLFLLNKSDAGGLLSFKASNAATLADLSGKRLQGVQLPDNAAPSPIAIQFGTATANDVSGTTTFGSISGGTLTTSGSGTVTIKKASAQMDSSLDLTATPATGNAAYATNAVFDTIYPNLGAVPGLYYVPPSPGDEGSVLLLVAKLNNKLVAFGSVFNLRGPDVDPLVSMPNTGAFVAFEP